MSAVANELNYEERRLLCFESLSAIQFTAFVLSGYISCLYSGCLIKGIILMTRSKMLSVFMFMFISEYQT